MSKLWLFGLLVLNLGFVYLNASGGSVWLAAFSGMGATFAFVSLVEA